MNVLLTGFLSPMIWGMTKRLQRDDHHVTMVGKVEGGKPEHSSVVYYDLDPGDNNAQKILRSNRFHAVVFFYAYQCEESQIASSVQGTMLDALIQIQRIAAQCGVERFYLISDRRVFGSTQSPLEDVTPIPDSPDGILIKAAEDCLNSSNTGAMTMLIVRVTSLYQPGTADAFFGRALRHASSQETMVIDATDNSSCDFLHVDDLALFISLSLETDVSGIVNLAYGDDCTYANVVDALKQFLPTLTAAYTGRRLHSAGMETSSTAKEMGWIPRHLWSQEINEIVSLGDADSLKKNSPGWFQGIKSTFLGKVLPWAELILFGWAARGLYSLSSVYASFRIVDVWLFYTIMIGSLHGGLMGISAGLIACLSYALEWTGRGNDLYLLLYNMDNWLPLIMYLLAGGLFGHMHDKTSEQAKMLDRETQEKQTRIAFLESMYKQASEDRSRLKDQITGYRDSYGRIYQITQKLDTQEPEQVFLSTLNVLEDTMQNHSVAIYSRIGYTSFARLVVCSGDYKGELPKSPDLNKYPLMKSRLDRGECFNNTALEPGYPVFCAPIMKDDKPIAMIALWDVPFDQQTLYHLNLFSVVVGLVQSAMVRTLTYFSMSQGIYLEGSRILTDKAFRSALGVHLRMKKQRASNHLLLKVEGLDGKIPLEELDSRIVKVIRATDIVGRTNDGINLVLMPQSSRENISLIVERFENCGLICEILPSEYAIPEAAHA